MLWGLDGTIRKFYKMYPKMTTNVTVPLERLSKCTGAPKSLVTIIPYWVNLNPPLATCDNGIRSFRPPPSAKLAAITPDSLLAVLIVRDMTFLQADCVRHNLSPGVTALTLSFWVFLALFGNDGDGEVTWPWNAGGHGYLLCTIWFLERGVWSTLLFRAP
jgi:hypothetical protein